MTAARFPISPAGLSKVKTDLKRLKEVERPKNLDDIARARDHGDLSENAEYQYAKEQRLFINAQIARNEDIIARAQVIDPTKQSGHKVVFGARVTVYDVDSEEEATYQILSAVEANPAEGVISVDSPIARALIGKEEGDEVVLPGDAGRPRRHLEVVEVAFG